MMKYNPVEIEKKFRQQWRDKGLYKIDLKNPRKKFYLLVEFTYPSGDLHMGHWFAFAVPDILARKKRMEGFEVFAPNGFDAFGLPAENAAIKRKIHPKDWTYSNIQRMKEQFETMGASYDWEHEVISCDPIYFKWNQWIFLKMFERGLAYKGKILSNWCPTDQTVLANENVENGKCWRCGTEVVQKEVEQWFFKITEYAEKLIWDDEPDADWPKAVRDAQNNWIGKSEGAEVEFKVKNSKLAISVFTTRPDTLFGATFMVLSPEHPIVPEITEKSLIKKVSDYQARAAKKSELERKENKEKIGVFTGTYAINPVSGEEIPIWVADYVLMGYGTGAIMAVPAHDGRDWEFAKKFKLPIKKVIAKPHPPKVVTFETEHTDPNPVYEGEGTLINSGDFNGLSTVNARRRIIEFLEKKGSASREVNYHLHDWSISRQRYWGTPIPIIYCQNCGTVPVPEKDLPVELPYDVDFAPHGKPPLATAEQWVNVKCPNCSGQARREVETMDTFIDSAWYFLRYLDPKNNNEIASKKTLADWMPVDIYFGGAEHTLGHTLYSRFFVKFLQDIGAVPNFGEYAKKRVHHGVILGTDGSRMSKSKGNVVNPDEEVSRYGADAVRLYLAFLGPYDLVAAWNTGGIGGVYNFLTRVWNLFDKVQEMELSKVDVYMMHRTIKKVGDDIENTKFNTAVSALMEWLNYLGVKKDGVSSIEYKGFLKLLAPFVPHITDQLWEMMGEKESIHQESWPKFDVKLAISEKVTLVVQVNGKLRERIEVDRGISKDEAQQLALKSENVSKYISTGSDYKVVFVADRLINFVSPPGKN